MTPVQFKEWKANNPALVEKYIFPTEGKDCNWGKLVCIWHEKKESGEVIQHIFCTCIDLRNGDVYLDCSKKKIYAKHICIVGLRCLQGIMKTAYHILLPVSIPMEIYNTIKSANKINAKLKIQHKEAEMKSNCQIAKECIKNSAKSLADIVRTPVYCTAMAAVSIAAVIIGPLSPTRLYDLRKVSGDLEDRMNWGKKHSAWEMTPCFHPITNIKDLTEKRSRYTDRWNTDYSETPTDLEMGMNNFARSCVEFLRNEKNLFHDCCHILPDDVRYVSQSYGDVEKWKEDHTFVDLSGLEIKSPIEGIDFPKVVRKIPMPGIDFPADSDSMLFNPYRFSTEPGSSDRPVMISAAV